MRAVGPEFVENVAGVAGQSVASLPSGVPRVGVLVVSSDTVLGGKQRFSVVFHDATDGEFKVRPCVDQITAAVVQFKSQFAPRHPGVPVGGFVGGDAVNGPGWQDVVLPR